jgi:hypothetical protein
METENLKTENRGVKKGIKRGPYKKNKIENLENLENNNVMTESIEYKEPDMTTNNFVQTTGEENLDNFLNEYKDEATDEEIKQQFTEKETVQKVEQIDEQKIIINGYMLLAMSDFIFPLGLKFLYGFFDVRAKQIDINDVKLSPEQKEALMSSADAVAQYIFQKANPLVIFSICMALFYGTNFMTALNNIPKQPKPEKIKK